MNYALTPMTRAHLPALEALEQECFSLPWSRNMLAEELINDAASYIVAEAEDGTVLGYAGLHVVLDEGYITNIAVSPHWRRQGIAARLLDAFVRFGQAHLAFLTLEVRASNTAAIGLYESFGFTRAGLRRGYYDAPKEDALLMTRTFTS